VPADPSSPIPAALTQLIHTDPRQLHDAAAPHLLAYLASVPDPRSSRGRRHPLVAILGLAAAAVLAGARSIAAIAEWAADAPQPVRAALGARHHAPGYFAVPAEVTIRRTLARPGCRRPGRRDRRLAGRSEASGSRGQPTARGCAAPVRQAVTVARCTCWRRWITQAERC
jgi:DDE_Tnp_1-associated